MGAGVFLGLDVGPESKKVNQAFVDELAGVVTLLRKPLPGTAMRRALKARAYLFEFMERLIPERRVSDYHDLFSEVCRARSEDGDALSDAEILGHMNFLLMAAHDTTTSSLTKMAWAMAMHPEWQECVREEVFSLGAERLAYEDLGKLEVTERAFNEALRLLPPVFFLPRKALQDFEIDGYTIPRGTVLTVSPGHVQRMPEYWSNPDAFDPDRFGPERREQDKHRFAFAPFGGGVHKCLGMHFAYMQMKVFVFHLLRKYRIRMVPGHVPAWKVLPVPKPVNGLPMVFEKL